jgi:hypothetical protein
MSGSAGDGDLTIRANYGLWKLIDSMLSIDDTYRSRRGQSGRLGAGLALLLSTVEHQLETFRTKQLRQNQSQSYVVNTGHPSILPWAIE